MGRKRAPRNLHPRVRWFARRLRERLHIQKILLFGSRARGDHLADSDYDFLIVSPDFQGVPFPSREPLVSDLTKLPLEALCYTPEEFQRKRRQIGIVAEAVREGLEL